MSHRTIDLSSFDEYLASECTSESGAREKKERDQRLSRFPYAVMLQVAFPELDFANRWCWQQFGPADGVCYNSQSDYPTCTLGGDHSHVGKWMWHFFGKTDYNFGYNEWYFHSEPDHRHFLASVGDINWGEKYEK